MKDHLQRNSLKNQQKIQLLLNSIKKRNHSRKDQNQINQFKNK